jgi:signal transduction histidine kinase
LGTDGLEYTTASEEAATSARPLDPAPELGKLLSGALERLAAETGARTATAWVPATEAAVRVAGFGELPNAPSESALEAVFASSGAIDLGNRALAPSLREYALDNGLTAAAPIAATEPIAAIFLGPAPGESAGSVRPRTLTALSHFVKRLQAPAETANTISRLAGAQNELFRLTRLATIGDLLAEAVHEIRNPLVSVKAFLQLLPDNLDDRDFTENFRENVINEVRRMERLLNSILQQARPKPSEQEQQKAAIGPVLQSVGRLFEKRAQQKQLRLVVDIRADLPPAAIGEDPLRQIVLNLILNALEATPQGGCVTLSASLNSDTLSITVDDEGPGISADERGRLFEPFFSTRDERPVGLGLTVCRSLVEGVEGTIHVEDAPNRAGTRFCVRLPIA